MEKRELRNSVPKDPVMRLGDGRVVIRLAELPAQTLLDERALAASLGLTMRTVRRMVRRNELPPPVPFGGRSTWMVANVLAHFARRAERAARDAERETQRLAALSAGPTPMGVRRGQKKVEGIAPPSIVSDIESETRSGREPI